MSLYGDDLENSSTNPSTASPFQDVVERRLSRRGVLVGGAASAIAFMAPGLFGNGTAAAAALAKGGRKGAPLLGYTPVPLSRGDEVVVPAGYSAVTLIPWGTRLSSRLPERFDPATMTAAEQEQRVGMHHDGMHFFPLEGSRRGLLVVNHEYTDEQLLHTGGRTAARPARLTEEQRKTSQAAHGVSVVEVVRGPKGWDVVLDSRYNRRITAGTPMRLSGPAAGHRLLRTSADTSGTRVLGTINNCSHGYTPWGTYLIAEENFNGYFRTPAAGTAGFAEAAALARYGVGGDSYLWADTDSRFDLVPGVDENEVHRFGWVVEFDPSDPTSVPTKRTALGRTKHEGAFVHVTKGQRVVVYMGDDQANDYAYKFVSAGNHTSLRARGLSPLDEGTLYVARFKDDGTGEWLPLVHGTASTAAGKVGLTAARGFADQGEVLVKARLAADELGATPMDRPEWTTVDPTTGAVYLTLTNNSGRTVTNGPNPRPRNTLGQVVRWFEDGDDHAATTFRWDLFLVAGAGRDVVGATTGRTDGSTIASEDAFGSPDGLWADPDGRIWIQTDGTQPTGANDQMLAADPGTLDAAGVPEVKRFLTGVRGAEVTGVVTTPDQRTMFVNLQHPGDGDAGIVWPKTAGYTFPRSATVVITKDDGGIIGT